MKNAIVTGANGFIGSHVCRALLNNHIKVYAVVRNVDEMRQMFPDNELLIPIECEMHEYGKLSRLLPKEIDVFYHFAWIGSSGVALQDYKQQIEDIKLTCDAITVAAEISCKKFILAGTINELELFQFFNAEKNTPRKACIYGISKLACDLMGKTLAADLGIQFNTAVIGSCFGPGDKSRRIHNVFISHMINGKKPKLVEATNLHDWIYIDDVANMFYAIGNKSVNMKNYYIGHNQLRVLKDILNEVRDILNPNISLTFGEIEAPFLIDYSLVDINAVYEDTGYECKSDFKTSILETAEWVKNTDLINI